ncbi:group II intron reverse transcriptase/maturase [Desulfopila sp. IMCC35008]|uniref:group II intron reverse transcriptase/maturase n=1 Tax=Desulfopila sp. IMCC35008 TaxID=2653858 RepID=UPI0013CFEDDD|nr:group II intron reverse transcriptase/maturase [Desulfopila sp. IMCC35008]
MSTVKPFSIPKSLVWEAYQRVRSGGKSAGVDGQTLEDFEEDLRGNLYRLWNRMSSGSYFPPPVKRVEIPKNSGGTRPLGIPTFTDRIAQTVVKLELDALLDQHFHPDSYGYRPGKSAFDALAQTRSRCWKYGWVLDLDIKGFFDNLDHGLLLKAVYHHTTSRWHRLYIERWLKAPVQSGCQQELVVNRGTPQGGVVSPLLANLYLHYAFDVWMSKHFPHVVFERYADDIVVHARSQSEAELLKAAITKRLEECKLELHPQKTKIAFCKQWNRPGDWPAVSFDFLGYEFRPREVVNQRQGRFTGFLPAVSKKALLRMRKTIRQWQLISMCHMELEDISEEYSAMIQGWIQYYGRYYKRKLFPLLNYIDTAISSWACRKFRKFHGRLKKAREWVSRLAKREPTLFPHWEMAFSSG